ncbi:SGNH/GDSL hydrolase family protein [Larkinella punicea]|uniref:SGNH/GDSL hydrolase family protein n=1 Tax=Larkinella punicea TaxID=2315727 RepID=A0A368JMB5_9BACT|nr:SGNH/GDSL hydrolase family protein [Larkinella punicea]RCR67703.1 SGNH/GDSL hydrolase family protein [Larkinella punicea]
MAILFRIFSRLSFFLVVYTVLGCTLFDGLSPKDKGSNVIVGWGDSMTEGSNGSSYLIELQKLAPQYTFVNEGISGEKSYQIAKRMLAATDKHSYNTIIWAGRNNYLEPEQIKADIASMVKALGHDRYLVLSIVNGSFGQNEDVFGAGHDAIMKLNGELYTIYGDHYVNIHAYLLSQYDRSSYLDIVDHTDDVVPRSLRFDPLHLNEKGNQKVAERIFQSLNVLTNP